MGRTAAYAVRQEDGTEEVAKNHHNEPLGNDDLLTVREVAKRLKVDDTTVRRWVKNKALKAVSLPHVGKRQAYRIKRSVLESVLNGEFAEAEV
jgi:excisionase family DNA binding protein